VLAGEHIPNVLDKRKRSRAFRGDGEQHRVPIDAAQLASGALGGAIVSGIIGPLIAQRHERRDLRADAFRCVTEVERTR